MGTGQPFSRGKPSLQAKALSWLARREHSRQELQQKLSHWARLPSQDVSELAAEIEQVLDALQAAGHLSDQRFVESRVHARLARFGNRRIEQELRSKGAGLDAAQRQALGHSELERARAVWRTRFGDIPHDPRERARQMRFLAARGFTADTIARLLREPEDPA